MATQKFTVDFGGMPSFPMDGGLDQGSSLEPGALRAILTRWGWATSV